MSKEKSPRQQPKIISVKGTAPKSSSEKEATDQGAVVLEKLKETQPSAAKDNPQLSLVASDKPKDNLIKDELASQQEVTPSSEKAGLDVPAQEQKNTSAQDSASSPKASSSSTPEVSATSSPKASSSSTPEVSATSSPKASSSSTPEVSATSSPLKAPASGHVDETSQRHYREAVQAHDSSQNLIPVAIWHIVKYLFLLFASVATVAFALVFGVSIYRSYFVIPPEIEVPAISGKDFREVNSLLNRLGLRLRIEEGRYSEKFPDRIVISQDPKPGKKVRKDREILAVVSLGPEQIAVPNLKGKSLKDAKMILANSRLELGNVKYTKNDSNKPDEILKQKPEFGANTKRGAKVNVEVNRGFGLALVSVPDWKGKSISNATPLLDKVGLRMGSIIWQRDESVPKGRIVSQTPPAGAEVNSESTVTFVVSAGSEGQAVFVQHRLMIPLPAGSDSHSVRVMLLSGAGEEQVYKANHVVGDSVDMWVSGASGSDVEVYINDIFSFREKL